MNVIDANGVSAIATSLEGPTVLNTPEGEYCAEEGQVLVQYPGVKPLVFTTQQFEAQFTVL